MKMPVNFIYLPLALAICGCHNTSEKQKIEQLEERIKRDSIAYSDLKEENKRLWKLCGKNGETDYAIKRKKIREEKKESSARKEKVQQILAAQQKRGLHNTETDKNKGGDSLLIYPKENKKEKSIKDASEKKDYSYLFPKIDSLKLDEEYKAIHGKFINLIRTRGERDNSEKINKSSANITPDKTIEDTLGGEKIGYIRRLNWQNKTVEAYLFNGKISEVMVNYLGKNWEIWRDENGDGKIDFYGRDGLAKEPVPVDSLPQKVQKEIPKRLADIEKEIIENAGWKY